MLLSSPEKERYRCIISVTSLQELIVLMNGAQMIRTNKTDKKVPDTYRPSSDRIAIAEALVTTNSLPSPGTLLYTPAFIAFRIVLLP